MCDPVIDADLCSGARKLLQIARFNQAINDYSIARHLGGFAIALELAREFVRPGQGCLIGERRRKYVGAGFTTMAQFPTTD